MIRSSRNNAARALWFILAITLAACGASPAVPTIDLTSRDATSIARQMATIDARNALATLTSTYAPATSTSIPTPAPTLTPTLQPTPTPAKPLALLLPDNDHANVRSGPGTDYAIAGQLQPGVAARVIGRNDANTWWQIETDNTSGWVSSELVEIRGTTTLVQPVQVAPVPTVTPSQQPYVLVKAGYDYVNVRSGPALTYEVAGQLQPGTPLHVTGTNSAGWWQVDFNGTPRWVDASFVDLLGNASGIEAVVVPPVTTTVPTVVSAVAAPHKSASGCPMTSSASYGLVPRDGPASNRPDRLHGDLNLALRGYGPSDAPAALVDYSGATDANAPHFMGMFQPNRAATVQSAFRVNLWYFEPEKCNGAPYGCAGPAITSWPVTMLGLATAPGEPIAIPSRGVEIWPGYQALVLYADARRITLSYTRQDNISYGYAVYIENVCVDPNLLALYRAQNNADGWRISTQLPALRNGQSFGTAAGGWIGVAIRDSATFMDPRSRKDWWR